MPWFTPKTVRAISRYVAVVKEWARRKEATPAQIALAWLMAQEPVDLPILGIVKDAAHLLDNIGADAVRFTPG